MTNSELKTLKMQDFCAAATASDDDGDMVKCHAVYVACAIVYVCLFHILVLHCLPAATA